MKSERGREGRGERGEREGRECGREMGSGSEEGIRIKANNRGRRMEGGTQGREL